MCNLIQESYLHSRFICKNPYKENIGPNKSALTRIRIALEPQRKKSALCTLPLNVLNTTRTLSNILYQIPLLFIGIPEQESSKHSKTLTVLIAIVYTARSEPSRFSAVKTVSLQLIVPITTISTIDVMLKLMTAAARYLPSEQKY